MNVGEWKLYQFCGVKTPTFLGCWLGTYIGRLISPGYYITRARIRARIRRVERLEKARGIFSKGELRMRGWDYGQ